jgi:predicted nucleic acid-binding protein
MAVRVVDASVIAAILFAEPDAERLAQQLEGVQLLAPTLLPFEVASVRLKKIRRHPAQRGLLLEGYGMLAWLDVTVHKVNVREVVELAERSHLTVYDATYLWLAQESGAELVTLDKTLARVAKQIR